MEQRLIDKQDLAEIYRKWIDDCASENMKTECGVIEDCLCELDAQPEIDPVQAAGACYCGECKHNPKIAPKNNCPFAYDTEDEEFYTFAMKPTDFCSYGERRAE